MIIITRTYKTLSPCGGWRNFVNHRETKCFNDDDKKGVEEYLNLPVSVLQEKESGYDIYSLNYDVQKL